MAETKKATTKTAEAKKTTTSKAKATTSSTKTTKAATTKSTAKKTTAKAEAPVAEVKVEAPAVEVKAAPVKKETKKGPMLSIKLVKSKSGRLEKQIKTLTALGLNKINQVVTKPDNAATRGMIFVVKHLVEVTEIK